jgi:hypothetical protein
LIQIYAAQLQPQVQQQLLQQLFKQWGGDSPFIVMEDQNKQQIEVTETVTGKTVFSLNKPTPMWATWVFRGVFVLTGVITFVVAAEPALADDIKIRLGIYLKGIDMLVWGLTRVIGVEVSRDFNIPQ